MKKLIFAAATIVFLFSFSVSAQSTTPAPPTTQPQEISPEKRALAKELVDAMGMKKQAGEMLTAMETELSKEMVETTWQTISAMPEMKVLTEAERQDLQKQIAEISVTQFHRMVEAITKKIDYGQVLEDVSIVVYTKYFNEKELKDLIAFYKSDTGQKSIELTPKMLADSMSEASKALMPVLNEVTRDIAADDTNKLRDKVTAMAKAHHRQTTSKGKP